MDLNGVKYHHLDRAFFSGTVLSHYYPLLAVLFPIGLLHIFWSSIAFAAKRFHDLGWPGWLILLGLIPLFGQMFLFFTICSLKGMRGPNPYGLDPRRIWSAGIIDEI